MGFFERGILRLLLSLYPRDFRTDVRDQWMEFVQQQRREEKYRRRGWGRIRFWKDVIKDALVSVTQVRREARLESVRGRRDERRSGSLETLIQDLRFALRTLRRRPFYTGVAIVTLGLGIGAAAAMFSVVDGVLLADVQYRDPDRLMSIWQRIEGRSGYTEAGEIRLQYRQYRALREQTTVFEGVAVYAADWGESTLGGGSRPELVSVGATTASLLPVVGITPILGRWFLPDEEGEGAGDQAMVTVMSHDTWTRRFAADRDVLGQSVIINDFTYTVVGVLPPGFRMQWLSASITGADDPGPRDFWVPVGSAEWGESPGSTMWEAIGRLTEGVTVEEASAETSAILSESWPSRRPSALILPRREEETRGLGSPIFLLFGATGLLLLIACGNVAALSLGEMHGRMQEVATRTAIGAGRSRIVRQLMTESVLLGIVGSAVGALVAVVGTGVLVDLAPPIPRIDEVHANPAVLAFAALLGTLAGVLFGLAPALMAAREETGVTLRSGIRAGSRHRAAFGRAVLVGEISLTVMLLVAGGLLARSISQLLTVPLGFDPRNLATIEVTLPDSRYGWDLRPAAWNFMDEVIREMESIPGAAAVSAANMLPFPDSPSEWASYLSPEDTTYLMPELFNVAPGYLDFMGIPILEGRGLLPSDDADGPPVAVVNQRLARALWGDRSPVGEEMLYPMGSVTVVGVAADARQSVLQHDPPLTFYVPYGQHSRSRATFAVRARGRPQDLLPAMREALWRVDDELAITASGTLEAAIVDSASEERFRTLLMTVFAALATLLAAVGIMGVTARNVSQRTRELGIRKAMGAADDALLGEVIRSAALTGLLGVGLGLAGAYALRPLLAAFLFGVGSFDLPTYAGVGVFLLLVSVLASYLPGRRLLEVDPAMVMRVE
jgi:putative ABC transport system permease protein